MLSLIDRGIPLTKHHVQHFGEISLVAVTLRNKTGNLI
jgi:hypothetical protein